MTTATFTLACICFGGIAAFSKNKIVSRICLSIALVIGILGVIGVFG